MRFEFVRVLYTATGPSAPISVEDLQDMTLSVQGGTGYDFDLEGTLDGSVWFVVQAAIVAAINNQAITGILKAVRAEVTTVGTAPTIRIYGRNVRTQ